MKLTVEYIQERLQDTNVDDLALEIATDTARQYANVNMAETVAKFKKMITPYAPLTVKATDFMRANGVNVIEIN